VPNIVDIANKPLWFSANSLCKNEGGSKYPSGNPSDRGGRHTQEIAKSKIKLGEDKKVEVGAFIRKTFQCEYGKM